MTPPFVKRYLIAVDKYKWIGLAGFVVVMGASGFIALQPEAPPDYIADGALTYSGPPVSFSATGSQIQQQGQELSREFLLSNKIVENVATQVNIKPQQVVKNVALLLPEEEKKGEGQSSSIIVIKYKDTEPKRGLEALSTLMQGMVQQSRERNTARLRSIIESVDQRVKPVRDELTRAEQQLEVYDRSEGPAISAAEDGSLLGAITGQQNQRRQIDLTLAGIDAQIGSLQSKLGLEPNAAYVSSALSADPIIGSLRSQIYQTETQISIRSKDLRPEHPTMIELRRQLQSYEQLLQERAVEVIGGGGTTTPLPLVSSASVRIQSSLDPARQQLANSLVGLQTQKETLQRQRIELARSEQELRQAYASVPNKQLQRARYAQQVALKKALYDQIQAKLVDARAAEAETVSSLSVARPATVAPVQTTGKSVPLILGAGTVLGLLVGGGIIFLLGSLESTFRTMEDIRESLRQQEVPVLGILPLIQVAEIDSEPEPILISPDSPYLQYYERCRSSLRRMGDKALKVVLITSTVKKEGKTICAYNLAIASARAGKRTLIVEADLRSPSHAEYLNVTPDPDSAIEPARYYGSLSQCIRLVPEIENLYIVPSPPSVGQTAAVLESSEMRRLLEDVRGRFDLVILDTPALSSSNDAILLEPYSDGILLVTRPGFTEENLLAEAIDQLMESDMRLLGAVINGVEVPAFFSEPSPNVDVASNKEEVQIKEVPTAARQS